MIPKVKNIEFLTFTDGIVALYQTDDNDEIMPDTKAEYCFGNRTVGVKRYFAARQNDIELEKVIHIHQDLGIHTSLAAVIGGTRYKIEQVQQLSNTNPKCTVLSLSQRGLYEGDCNDET